MTNFQSYEIMCIKMEMGWYALYMGSSDRRIEQAGNKRGNSQRWNKVTFRKVAWAPTYLLPPQITQHANSADKY